MPDGDDARGRRYTVSVNGEAPTEVTESALMSAWLTNVPDLALRLRALGIGEGGIVFRKPDVFIRRLQ
jgi:hypothetical protein